jgi:hypothetical protein
LRNCRYGCS